MSLPRFGGQLMGGSGGLSVRSFKPCWREVVERRVPTPGVVEPLDEIEDDGISLRVVSEAPAVEQLAFHLNGMYAATCTTTSASLAPDHRRGGSCPSPDAR